MGRAVMLIAAMMIWAIGPAAAHGTHDHDHDSIWDQLKAEFPKTDFTKASISMLEVFSGGPPRDGIPAIDEPIFVPVSTVDELPDQEPVISLVINGVARAYPQQVLMWHEIVNDTIGGKPVAVTYCPLCDSALVFDRTVDGQVLDFGTTGRLRNSDLLMYDRQTETWWQQFIGEGVIGAHTGTVLDILPSRVEGYGLFRKRHPDGEVLVPANKYYRDYGANPYRGYDTAARPFLYRGALPEGIAPMARVVRVGDQAWALDLLREGDPIEADGLVITWEAGRASALDRGQIRHGRDIGNVVVQRRDDAGVLQDVAHDTTFAFAFHAFYPEGTLHTMR